MAIAGILFTISYVNSANTALPKQEPLSVPSAVPYKNYISGAGITEPNSENISIGTNKAGIVKAVYVQVGQEVKRNDILFTIENSEAVTALEQTLAELKTAQDNYNIIAAIKDKRAISTEEKNQKFNALELAKAKVKSATVNLELHNVRAPINGVILSTNIRVGEFAQTGAISEPLMRMGNISPMYIRVDIDENDAWRFKENSRAIAYVRGNNDIKTELQYVRKEPYVRPKKSLTGDSIERVDTRVMQVIFMFDPEGQPILVGQQMDVYIEDEE